MPEVSDNDKTISLSFITPGNLTSAMADNPCQLHNLHLCISVITPSTNNDSQNDNSGGSQLRGSITVRKLGNNYIDPDYVTDLAHWVVVFVLTPSISILGIVGNIFSLIVLAKHGFHKSSNILLFSLATSDILFMIGINGPSKPMYEWGGEGFSYPEPTARILYYVYQVTDSFNWICCPTSCFIPVLIMIERLIAVFLPLRFKTLVTVRRTVAAVLAPLLLSILTQAYVRTWFQFSYVFDPVANISVGMVGRSELYWQQRQVSEIFKICDNAMFILVLFVGAGCLAIGIKMKMVAKKRLQMTNNFMGQKCGKSEGGSSKTTKMLLCVCVFYTFACIPVGFPAVIPGFMVFPVFEDEPRFRSVGVFVFHVYKLVFCINASCNFYIYVATNQKFRDTFRSLFRR